MLQEKVKELLDKALQERQDLFLLDLNVSADNQIKVVIDGDEGVNVDDCVFVSRSIEHHLDREAEDFSLEVTSAGATSPLINNRQYKKNIGRALKVKTEQEEIKGDLIAADEGGIILTWKSRESKPVGKGKITVQKEKKISYSDIIEAKVMIKF